MTRGEKNTRLCEEMRTEGDIREEERKLHLSSALLLLHVCLIRRHDLRVRGDRRRLTGDRRDPRRRPEEETCLSLS